MKRFHITIFLLLFSLVVIFTYCTQNPLFNDASIPVEKTWIKGKVIQSNGSPANGALAWLEGFNIGTYVDEKGDFALQIPVTGYSNGSVNGNFTLYLFYGNFKVEMVEISIVNGEVRDGQSDMGTKGYLKHTITLKQLIKLHSSVSFYYRWHAVHPDSCLKFNVEMEVLETPVTILTKKGRITSGFLLPEAIDGQDNIILDIPNEPFMRTSIWKNPYSAGTTLNWSYDTIKSGTYQYVPWILAYQPDLPDELFEFLDVDFDNVDYGYLNIPMVRTGGRFLLNKADTTVINLPDLNK
ncbi:hypothetical protein KAR48_02670 [bacterium]|nr:hypothetical protein [bacterium]